MASYQIAPYIYKMTSSDNQVYSPPKPFQMDFLEQSCAAVDKIPSDGGASRGPSATVELYT